MNPDSDTNLDKYQQAWQTQAASTRVTVDPDLLRMEVQRNQRDFRAFVSRQDFALVAISLLLLPVWIYMGVSMATPWTWYLAVPAFLWVIGFILVFRARYERAPAVADQSLLSCVKESLALVDHRLWLQRNAFWWSILPMIVPLLAFTAHLTWLKYKNGTEALGDVNAAIFVGLVLLLAATYYLNRRAANRCFRERRQELLTLLGSLGDESAGEFATAEPTSSAGDSTWLARGVAAAVVSCVVTFAVFVLASGKFDFREVGPPTDSGAHGEALARLVATQRQDKNLVSLAAMVMVDGRIDAAAAVGERRKGSGVPVEVGDRWHLGGIAKSVTATMIARLIEAGQLHWTDTVGEVFPDAEIHDDWKQVTLRQLLTDIAGAPKNFTLDVRLQQPPLGAECTRARRAAVLNVLAARPVYPPGSKFEYSNVGYTIAAAMAEQVTGETWEDLVQREVYEPLELADSGFGPPKSSAEKLEQPRGHRNVLLAGKVSVGDQTDNTMIMAPSGAVHMTLENLCRYAREHLQGDLGHGKLLSTDTYQQLHALEQGVYACGWLKRDLGDIVYWHNGSNTMWYALVVYIPAKDMVVAVTSNDGDIYSAEEAAWEIVQAAMNDFKATGDDERLSKPAARTIYPKLSPYAAIGWQNGNPEVELDGEWFRLLAIDGVPSTDMIAFSRKTYDDKWQKRFEEDLVELLTRMGHPPHDAVQLVVQTLDVPPDTRTLNNVPMTRANRRAIRDAAQSRASP